MPEMLWHFRAGASPSALAVAIAASFATMAQPPFAFSLNDGFQDNAQIFINTLLLPLPMNISAYVEKEQKTKAVALREGALVKDLLSELGVNPVTVIVSRNNELMVDDDELNDGDSIKILSVISGG